MRNTSINVIMTAAAVSDICYLLIVASRIYLLIGMYTDPCFGSPVSYLSVVLDIIIEILNDCSQRCSTWISLSIATIRTLVVRNPMDPKFERLTKPYTALFVILGVPISSLPFSLAFQIGIRITKQKEFSECYPKGVLTYIVDQKVSVKQLSSTVSAIISNVSLVSFQITVPTALLSAFQIFQYAHSL